MEAQGSRQAEPPCLQRASSPRPSGAVRASTESDGRSTVAGEPNLCETLATAPRGVTKSQLPGALNTHATGGKPPTRIAQQPNHNEPVDVSRHSWRSRESRPGIVRITPQTHVNTPPSTPPRVRNVDLLEGIVGRSSNLVEFARLLYLID